MVRYLARPYTVHTSLGTIVSDRYYLTAQAARDDGYCLLARCSTVTVFVSSSVGMARFAFVFRPGVFHLAKV